MGTISNWHCKFQISNNRKNTCDESSNIHSSVKQYGKEIHLKTNLRWLMFDDKYENWSNVQDASHFDIFKSYLLAAPMPNTAR